MDRITQSSQKDRFLVGAKAMLSVSKRRMRHFKDSGGHLERRKKLVIEIWEINFT